MGSTETQRLYNQGYLMPKVGISVLKENLHFTLRPDRHKKKVFNEVLGDGDDQVHQCDIRIFFKDCQTAQKICKGPSGVAECMSLVYRAAKPSLFGTKDFDVQGLYSAPSRNFLYQLHISGPACPPKSVDEPQPLPALHADYFGCDEQDAFNSSDETMYAIGEKVERRDAGKEWSKGYITCLDPLKVTVQDDPNAKGYSWDEVRPLIQRRGLQQ